MGFDWEKVEEVAQKVEEEWGELQNARTQEEKQEEFGMALNCHVVTMKIMNELFNRLLDEKKARMKDNKL